MNPETPVPTEARQILAALQVLSDAVQSLADRLDQHAEGINIIGKQVNWLTENTQGIFAFMSSPAFTSQIMGSVSGMLSGGGFSVGANGAADGHIDELTGQRD